MGGGTSASTEVLQGRAPARGAAGPAVGNASTAGGNRVTARHAPSTVGPAMDREEPNVLRIVDGDERSLQRRVDLALSALPDGSRVDHFTSWYTGRPPLHEATVSPPGEGSGATPQ